MSKRPKCPFHLGFSSSKMPLRDRLINTPPLPIRNKTHRTDSPFLAPAPAMKASLYLVLATLFLACCFTTFAFVGHSALPSTRISTVLTAIRATRTRGVMTAGLFDGLFLSDTEKEDAYQKQQEILRARQNPEKQKAYFQEVNKRRATASQNFKEKFNLSKNGQQDPAVKWMELRKKGVIGEREKYEQYGETNRGIIIPQVHCCTKFGPPSQSHVRIISLPSFSLLSPSHCRSPSAILSTTRASGSTCVCLMWMRDT